jgi:selenophosphate synthase
MAQRSQATMKLFATRLPLYPGAREAAESGTRTGGDARNRAYLDGVLSSEAPPALEALALDPQTSGGLLAAVPSQHAGALASQGWSEVGEVAAGPAGVVLTDETG